MPRRGPGAGRPGALDEARELVALVASLSEAGDALTAEAVASRLGTSVERAEKLISLVLTSVGTGGATLPLVEDGGEVTLAFSQGVRGRRLRLTRTETLALAAALERLGVDGDDPLRARLEQAAAREGVDEALVRRVVSEDQDVPREALEACARALVRREDLSFSYRKSPDAAAEGRLVRPEGLRHEDGSWYLDALDLGRGARRTFRLDRMEGVRGVAAREPLVRSEAGARRAREVRISFSDPSYLDLLPWHDLRVERTADGVQGVTPYYGGMWLPRMLAACGGTATTDDTEVAALARSYARGQLGRDAR